MRIISKCPTPLLLLKIQIQNLFFTCKEEEEEATLCCKIITRWACGERRPRTVSSFVMNKSETTSEIRRRRRRRRRMKTLELGISTVVYFKFEYFVYVILSMCLCVCVCARAYKNWRLSQKYNKHPPLSSSSSPLLHPVRLLQCSTCYSSLLPFYI